MPAMSTERGFPFFLVALGLIASLAGGCVQRTITITSEPSGALVHLNDEEVGRTPLTVPFTFYGVYDVRLEREGYQPLWTQHRAKAPWWEYPGPDLIAEAIPNAKSQLHWHFALEPAVEPEQVDTELLLDHAKQLRATIPADPSAQTRESR